MQTITKPVIRTYMGHDLNPLDLDVEKIHIEDIAHSLANINRFNGHTNRPISVAQHSVYVAQLCRHLPLKYQRQALLHDASEAYLGDVTKWLKMSDAMTAYREAEEVAQTAIFDRFDCPIVLHEDVEEADRIMVRFEGRHRWGFNDPLAIAIDNPRYRPLTTSELERVGAWSPWSWRQAKDMFLFEAERLGIK